MKQAFNIFAVCLAVGLIMIAYWNLNHVYRWYQSLDFCYGSGFAIVLVGCSYLINELIEGKRKLITLPFFYLSLSNLMDELFFDPFVVSIYEYISSLAIITIIYFYETRLRPPGNSRKS